MNPAQRKLWLKQRQQGVGATDIASLAGVGFRTAQEVYEEKVADEPIDRPGTELMLMGLATEDLNAWKYSLRTGRTVFSPGLVRPSSDSWVFATIDRCSLDMGDDFGRPIELKYTPFFDDDWGPDGSDDVDPGYIVQAEWQLITLRARGSKVVAGDLSAMDAYGKIRIYSIAYDTELAALLLELGEGFWRRVETRTGLDDWDPPVKGAIAAKLRTINPDTSTELGMDALAVVAEMDALQMVKKTGDDAEKKIKDLKAQLGTLLGSYELGLLPDGRRVRQYPVPAKLITPQPYERTARVDVRILNPKKEKPSRE